MALKRFAVVAVVVFLCSALKSAELGTKLWTNSLDFHHLPAVRPDGSVVGASGFSVYMLDSGGTIARQLDLDGIPIRPVVRLDGGFITGAESNLVSYSSAGDVQWKYRGSGLLTNRISLGLSNNIFACFAPGTVSCLDQAGILIWEKPVSTNRTSPVSIDSTGVGYIRTGEGYIYAINPNGTQRWRSRYASVEQSPPALAPPVPRPDGTIVVQGMGYVYCYDANDGVEKWLTKITVAPSDTIGELDLRVDQLGRIYVMGRKEGYSNVILYRLLPNGTLEQTIPMFHEIWDFCIGSGGTWIISGQLDNEIGLYEIDPETFKKRWFVDSFFWQFTIGPDSNIYGFYRQNAFCIGGSEGLAQTGWPATAFNSRGSSSVKPLAHMQIARTTGGVAVSISNSAGSDFIVESSSDMKQWDAIICGCNSHVVTNSHSKRCVGGFSFAWYHRRRLL